MAKFNIQKDSLSLIGNEKVGMTVTFKTDSTSVTHYHEAESADTNAIEEQLQMSADEFEGRLPVVSELPDIATGKDISIKLIK